MVPRLRAAPQQGLARPADAQCSSRQYETLGTSDIPTYIARAEVPAGVLDSEENRRKLGVGHLRRIPDYGQETDRRCTHRGYIAQVRCGEIIPEIIFIEKSEFVETELRTSHIVTANHQVLFAAHPEHCTVVLTVCALEKLHGSGVGNSERRNLRLSSKYLCHYSLKTCRLVRDRPTVCR